VKTLILIVVFYALINIYYSFLPVFLNNEGISIPRIGMILTVALLPAVGLEVPIGQVLDRGGIRKILSVAIVLTALTALMIPLSRNLYFTIAVVTAFTVSYTAIFIALYSRMSDVMNKDRVGITGVLATFKDLGYTIGPLLAGTMISLVGINNTFLMVGGYFLFLLPVSLTLHD
jgi:PPP family 3-phenylpropionic acid transporter